MAAQSQLAYEHGPMPIKHVEVRAVWDDDAGVWIAESEDVPGLVTEAASLKELGPILDAVIPLLLRENHIEIEPTDSRFEYRIIPKILTAEIDRSIEIPAA